VNNNQLSLHKKKWESDIGLGVKTLWQMDLKLDEFINVWWEDLCEQINFCLFNELWYKLRHKLAHWEISIEECNFENNLVVIKLFLSIFSLPNWTWENDRSR